MRRLMRFIGLKTYLLVVNGNHLRFSPFVSLSIFLTSTFFSISAIGSSEGKEDLRQKVMEDGLLRSLVEIRRYIPEELKPECFISHVCMPEGHPDSLWTSRIESYLRKAGIRTIYDMRDLRGAHDIEVFARQINSVQFVMTLFSPHYKENYEKRTWIHREAVLIKERLAIGEEGFFIPVLLAGVQISSIPSDFLRPEILYYPLTTGESPDCRTDWGECHEFIFRALKEKLYFSLFGVDAPYEERFQEIKRKFDIRKRKLPFLFSNTTFDSATGSYPKSLINYGVFLDRTDETGLSYLDRIFDELFINENDANRFSTLTLCAPDRESRALYSLCTALSGMAGVGKTTLAIEFSYRYHAFYDLIFWMNGESGSELLRSYLSLLNTLGVSIPEKADKEESKYGRDLIDLIGLNLRKKYKHWLLVIDNVEDSALVGDLEILGGHILLTSRHNDWLRSINIHTLKREESVRLLLQLTKLDSSLADQAEILAEELGDLPLALAQAAAYIKLQSCSSFFDYLELYRTSAAELLTRPQIQASLNRREAVIMTTWNTTIRKISPKAQTFMRLLAYCSPDNIPKAMFHDIAGNESVLELTSKELVDYSLVISRESGQISIHRLLQKVLNYQNKEALDRADLTSIILRDSYNVLLRSVHALFSRDEMSLSKEKRQRELCSHLQSLDQYHNLFLPSDELSLLLGPLLKDIGTALRYRLYDSRGSLDYFVRALDVFKGPFYSPDNIEMVSTLSDIGNVHRNLGNPKCALEFYLEALSCKKRIYGENHIQYANTLGNIGTTYTDLSSFDQAIDFHGRALAIKEGYLERAESDDLRGTPYPLGVEIGITLFNLGDAYNKSGRVSMAKVLLERSLHSYKSYYGSKHAKVADALTKLYQVYRTLGETEEATRVGEEALAIYEDLKSTYKTGLTGSNYHELLKAMSIA